MGPVSDGQGHTCAVRADGRLICFGENTYGQCDVPADVGPVLTVAAGNCHICAVRADGRLTCLGWNNTGQCDVPADLGPVLALVAGRGHTCAAQADGRLVCFAENSEGQFSSRRWPCSYLCSSCRWSAHLFCRQSL